MNLRSGIAWIGRNKWNEIRGQVRHDEHEQHQRAQETFLPYSIRGRILTLRLCFIYLMSIFP